MPPVIAQRYEILGALGQGGMGIVYRARDRVVDEVVVLKTMRSPLADKTARGRRFGAEVRMASRIRHKNICAIHGYGEEGDLRYIAMDCVDGIDLGQILREEGGFAEDEGYNVAIQVAKGLEAIHDAGVVHRDLKPEHIMRDSRGVIKLLNFRIHGLEDAESGTIVGTPAYMSPEQARGRKVDSRSDLYALGIVIFEIFTGQVPFRGSTPVVTLFKHLQEQPPLTGPQAAGIPRALTPVLKKLLAKDPAERYQTAGDVIDALLHARAASRRAEELPLSAPERAPATLLPDEDLWRALDETAPARPRGPEARAKRREGTDITRYPSIAVEGQVRPSAQVTLTVDLLLTVDPGTVSDGVRLADLAEDWKELEVDVYVESPYLSFRGDVNEGTVRVRRSAPSVPCLFDCTVASEVPSEKLELISSFYYRDRFCGRARRSFPLTRESAPSGAGRAASAGPPPAGQRPPAVAFPRDPHPPVLTVEISQDEDRPHELHWSLKVDRRYRGLLKPGRRRIKVGDPATYVRTLFSACESCQRGDHMRLMEGIGERLYEAAAEVFKNSYWSLRARLGDAFPIQFVSDDPHIPWELMRPVDPAGSPVAILAMTHPVARFLCKYEPEMRPEFRLGPIATIAPVYAESRTDVEPLPYAQSEKEMLRDRFHAIPIDGTRGKVFEVLEGRRVEAIAILHFAGHGHFSTKSADVSELVLEDGSLLALEVRRTETKLGERYGTFVILNACEVGATGRVLGTIGGWAESFLRTKFGGLIAPLWSVSDLDAPTAVEELVASLLKADRPVGEILQGIRASYGRKSPTFLSYIYYGDVMASFSAD